MVKNLYKQSYNTLASVHSNVFEKLPFELLETPKANLATAYRPTGMAARMPRKQKKQVGWRMVKS